MQVGDSRETELQNLLRDERDRCNQYKQIYQAIKEKHNKLQDELVLIRDQLKEANSQRERLTSSYDTAVRKLEAKIKEQQAEILTYLTKLKTQDEKKIRAEVLEEATTHYEAKIKELHQEAEKVREEYNELHFKNVVLKCDMESREADYSRSLESINRLHQDEIEQLQIKIETLEKEKSAPADTYAIELNSSKREILQLNAKIKTLLAECEELRAQNEHLSLQISSLNRTNSKQSSDHAANLLLIESEKQKVTMQKEILEKELANAQEHRKFLTNELQSSKREIISLRSKLEECEHKCHVLVTNLQVEMEQWKSDRESDQEQFVEEIVRLKSELQATNTSFSHERQAMVLQEQTLQQNLAVARQQVFKQSREFNQEKESLERKLKEIISEKKDIISHLQLEIQSLKQELHTFSVTKVELEKEILSLRDSSRRIRKDNEGPMNETPLKSSLNYEKEIQNIKEKIDMLLPSGSNERSQRFGDPATNSDGTNYEIIQMKLGWEQQKLQYQQRLEELESQLREMRSTSDSTKRELEFKVKQYTKQIVKLRERLDLQKVENEELEFQKSTLEKNIPPDVHSRVKNQLVELQKRVDQYRRLVTTDPSSATRSVLLPEKLLTDIKNIQFQTAQPAGEQDDVFQNTKENTKDKIVEKSFPKKTFRHRRRSLALKEKNYLTKTGSPVISSSSDLENL